MYMHKKVLALNNLKWWICYKTKPKQTKPKKSGNKTILPFLFKELPMCLIGNVKYFLVLLF